MKLKFEVQDTHLSRKQYSLNCSIVEPRMQKYFYHLNDDATHDLKFVHKVIVDLFNNEIMIIRSDKAVQKQPSTKTSML